jgi:hypothetical protein
MSNENELQTNNANPFDNTLTRSLKYSSIIGSAMGTLKAISIISSEPEIIKYASEKYAEIEEQLKEIYK